jgi:hypothetical protein
VSNASDSSSRIFSEFNNLDQELNRQEAAAEAALRSARDVAIRLDYKLAAGRFDRALAALRGAE